MRWLVLTGLLAGPAAGVHAQERVVVPSLDGTPLPGFLFGARPGSPQAAVILLHGCGGLMDRRGRVAAREQAWAARLAGLGYAALAIDSFSPRGVQSMCAPDDFVPSVLEARTKDAYGALLWLQSQPGIVPGRIGLMGWSEGGGVVLSALRTGIAARPASLPHGDFGAAIAFYPAQCNLRRQAGWRSAIPLQILAGGADVWTPAGPCKVFAGQASAQSPVSITVYPGAYHDFDWPGMAVHEVPAFRTRENVVPIEGYDPAAAAAANQAVPEFLAGYLHP